FSRVGHVISLGFGMSLLTPVLVVRLQWAPGLPFFATKESFVPGLSTTYARRHGCSSIRRHLWPLPTWSTATRTSPGRSTNVSPSGVANSSVPDSVITYCGSGSGCQSYEECAGVSL